MTRYGYVVYGLFILLCSGMVYAWSILSAPLAADFPLWSSAQLSFTFTLCMMFFCFGGLFNGLYGEKTNLKVIFITSAVLYLAGMLIAAQTSDSIASLYIGFGVFCGLATGLIYNAVISTIVGWFPDKPGLISGILLMGFGFGSFVIGIVYQNLLILFSWKQIFAGIGCLIFLCIFIGALYLKRADTKEEFLLSGDDFQNDFASSEMVKTKTFWIYFLWALCMTSSGYAVIGHANGILLEACPGIMSSTAPIVVGVVSIFNGAGRVIFGTIYDNFGQRMNMFFSAIVFAVSIVSLLLALLLHQILFLISGFVTGGLFFAALASTNSAFIRDFYGKKFYAANFAIVTMNVMISSFGGTVAGFLYDYCNSYVYVVLSLIIPFAVSIICSCFLKRPVKNFNEGGGQAKYNRTE